MLKLTSDGRIMVRRAADHITGRPCYRQKRRYFIQNAVTSETMGDCVDISGMKVSKLYADILVMTDGYFEMKEYNDFNSAYEINVNGIPDRNYLNKQILRIDFPDVERGVCRTLTLLINEVFRTMFAENQAFIVAVCNGDADVPLTYALNDNVGNDNSIYIIEDSQLDIGLLVAVRRNIRRILATICDYLDWHLETLDAVLNLPEPAAVPTAETEVKDADEDENGGKPKNKNFFKRIFSAIGGFFMKLFGGKKSSSDGDTPEPAEGTSSGGETAEQAPSKPEKKPGIFKRLFGRKKKRKQNMVRKLRRKKQNLLARSKQPLTWNQNKMPRMKTPRRRNPNSISRMKNSPIPRPNRLLMMKKPAIMNLMKKRQPRMMKTREKSPL